MRIGLLGGSFNPAHDGHRHISLLAARRLRLDAVWWFVTPGNPLKDARALKPIATRIAQARHVVAGDRRIVVSGFEAAAGTRYTADTLNAVVKRAPSVRFVWLMGADNLVRFHYWERWRDIVNIMPVAIIDRPEVLFPALSSPAAKRLAATRLPDHALATLPDMAPPAWGFLFGPRSPESSTRIRNTVR